jgi:hypothetical protein
LLLLHLLLSQQKQIQDKLGADWKLTVDWPSIQTATAEIPTHRPGLGIYIYERYCKCIGDELAQWGGDIVEAVNDSVTEKQIIIGMSPEQVKEQQYGVKVGEQYYIKVGKTIEVRIQPANISSDYPYSNQTTVTAIVEKSL